MKKFSIIILFALFLIQGCSWWDFKWGEEKPRYSFVTLKDKDDKEIGTMFFWNPDDVGAFVNQSGNVCIQNAEVFRTSNSELKLTAKVGAILEKAENIDVGLLNKITETAHDLANKNEENTYVNVSLFNLCMLCMNDYIDKKDAKEIIIRILDNAVKISKKKIPINNANSAETKISTTN